MLPLPCSKVANDRLYSQSALSGSAVDISTSTDLGKTTPVTIPNAPIVPSLAVAFTPGRLSASKSASNNRDQRKDRSDGKVEAVAVRFGAPLYCAESNQDNDKKKAYENSHNLIFPSGAKGAIEHQEQTS
jgi:hypothetical protein